MKCNNNKLQKVLNKDVELYESILYPTLKNKESNSIGKEVKKSNSTGQLINARQTDIDQKFNSYVNSIIYYSNVLDKGKNDVKKPILKTEPFKKNKQSNSTPLLPNSEKIQKLIDENGSKFKLNLPNIQRNKNSFLHDTEGRSSPTKTNQHFIDNFEVKPKQKKDLAKEREELSSYSKNLEDFYKNKKDVYSMNNNNNFRQQVFENILSSKESLIEDKTPNNIQKSNNKSNQIIDELSDQIRKSPSKVEIKYEGSDNQNLNYFSRNKDSFMRNLKNINMTSSSPELLDKLEYNKENDIEIKQNLTSQFDDEDIDHILNNTEEKSDEPIDKSSLNSSIHVNESRNVTDSIKSIKNRQESEKSQTNSMNINISTKPRVESEKSFPKTQLEDNNPNDISTEIKQINKLAPVQPGLIKSKSNMTPRLQMASINFNNINTQNKTPKPADKKWDRLKVDNPYDVLFERTFYLKEESKPNIKDQNAEQNPDLYKQQTQKKKRTVVDLRSINDARYAQVKNRDDKFLLDSLKSNKKEITGKHLKNYYNTLKVDLFFNKLEED